MIDNWVRFESIEIDKDGYYLTYSPIFTGQNLAVLSISFYEQIEVSKAVQILESELKHWIKKYPTPLMALASNKTNTDLDIKSETGNEFIFGYLGSDGNLVMKWEVVPDEEYSHIQFSKEKLLGIYEGLNYKTSKEAHAEISNKVSNRKKLIFVMLLWFSVIPALIAIFGWANPYVSFLALIYSLYVALKKGVEVTGHIKPSDSEKEKMKEEQEKEHHHYHCKENPDGFNRLKQENFSKESKERLKEKIEKLRS